MHCAFKHSNFFFILSFDLEIFALKKNFKVFNFSCFKVSQLEPKILVETLKKLLNVPGA